MDQIDTGLIVYRASRLEALLGPLTQLIDQHPPADVLAPQTVIAAHPGIRQWLSGSLARQRGAGGIAANLDIVLPSVWLDRLARGLQGESAVALAPYQRGSLRWRIHALLDTLDDAQVRRYLHGDDGARRRFQLADRLARIYTQYVVYRPDWLAAWAAGTPPRPHRGSPQPEGGILATLWAALRRQIGVPHRGELIEQMVRELQSVPAVADGADPLHVFGVSHLAPSELRVMAAVAQRRAVVLYVPDPCREYWCGLRSDRAALRERVERDPYGEHTESLFLDQGHPLLGAWGRMGQHFMLALEDMDVVIDVRHGEDAADGAPVATRLQRVQESIRQFAPDLLRPVGDLPTQRADASLRVHACHTRLRELEVLRDALLKARVDDPTLMPADIVVTAPAIQSYVPLLAAVFGEAGKHDGPLPYHIADVAVTRAHSLFEAFRRVLDLPNSRLGAPEIVDLLAVPEIARRLALTAADIDVLVGWLRHSRVAWALDADFRADVGVPPIAEHTFAWALDRMLAGYVLGAVDSGVVTLPDGVALAPLGGIEGPQAALLGALDRLLVQLARLHADGKRTQTARAWAQQLEAGFDGLFRIDARDAQAREAEAQLRRFIRAIASEPQQAGLDPELAFSVVRELLLERIDAASERQRFLMGGVTFCGMVPQRAIPFRVVAVLGLNDGEFPRAGSDGGLDLMTTHRRLGDRDVRSDDRYLFLETVMSARAMLHLSYIGEGVRDGKPRNPAAPLAELLAALDQAAGLRPDDADVAAVDSAATDAAAAAPPSRRPWRVRHPLQPFDARYFDDSDAALFSFQQGFAAMDAAHADTTQATSFVTTASTRPDAAPDSAAPIALRDVFAYFKDPARQLLAGDLNLRLDALAEDRLRDSEPLAARFEALDRVARRVFTATVMTTTRSVPEAAPDWIRLGGLLPPGRIGDQAWAAERDKVTALLAAVDGVALFDPVLPPASPLLIERTVGVHAVLGELRRVYDTDDARWIHDAFPGKSIDALDYRQRVGLFLEWALARLDDPAGQRSVRMCIAVGGVKLGKEQRAAGVDARGEWQLGFERWDAAFMHAVAAGDGATRTRMLAALTQRVSGLLEIWRAARHAPLGYFPRTSWLAVDDDERTRKAVQIAWAGGDYATGERDHAPGYARLLAGQRGFDGDDDYQCLLHTAERLRALITLPAASGDAA